MLYIFIFYFLSSALLDSWSVPPTGWYWFLTAFCYFLLWTHTVDAIKGGVWSFCNPIEGYRVRREDGERWLFSFFLFPLPRSPLPLHSPLFFPSQATAFRAPPVVNPIVLSPSKLFFSSSLILSHFTFQHWSGSALKKEKEKNLSGFRIKKEEEKTGGRPESISFKMQMQHFLISEINN